MKGFGLLSVVYTALCLFTAVSSAWPWPDSLNHPIDALILRRQEQRTSASKSNTASTDGATAETSESGAATSSAVESSAASESGSGSASASDTQASATGKPSGTKSSHTTSNASKTISIDPKMPAGGVQMITPGPIEGPQYYKVGDYVTFKWNYTSLSVTPSYIDVLASCSINSATYTIASNMSVAETGTVIWDTGEFESTATNPFPVASYTLIIHDSQKDITDVPSAGYLGAYQQYYFGMYTPQAYTPLNDFKCATCNSALSIHEKQALGVLLTTALITLLSFSWFANGFGVFS